MEISTYIDCDTVIYALTRGCGEDDPIKFVMDLDTAMADEGFTENLLLALAKSYEKEYITYEESLVGKAIESTFIDTTSTQDVRDKMRSRADEAMSKRSKLSQIVALIKSLNDDDDDGGGL
jgi:hypothetical protein